MRESAYAKAVDFESNIRDFIKLCLNYGGVPVFRTRYAGKRFDNLVLGVCYRGRVKAHMWFKNVPSDILDLMERTTGDWRWLLERYPIKDNPGSPSYSDSDWLELQKKLDRLYLDFKISREEYERRRRELERLREQITKLGDVDIAAAKKINELIDQRRFYGVREELAESDSTVITWSNAARDWFIDYARGKIKAGERVKLDANEVLAPFSPVRIERLKPFLKPLPLYMLSFEAKALAVDSKLHSALWAGKQIESKYRELWKRKYI
jgi:hypothetical protein